MKAKEKKCVVSRKKHTVKSKSKSISSQKTSIKHKRKKPSVVSAKPVKHSLRPSTKKGKPRNPKGTGGWPKGHSGNPKGRPKLGSTKLDNLLRSIRVVESVEGINILQDFIERSLASDTMAIALMKKLYPDLKSIEQLTLSTDLMSEKEAADIRKEIAKRFETSK